MNQNQDDRNRKGDQDSVEFRDRDAASTPVDMGDPDSGTTEPTNPDDVATGATIGGVGGAVAGAIAGSVLGPAGALAGSLIGGLGGAAASAAAVNIVDKYDNDAEPESSNVTDRTAETDVPLHDRVTGQSSDYDSTGTLGGTDLDITDSNSVRGTTGSDYSGTTTGTDVRTGAGYTDPVRDPILTDDRNIGTTSGHGSVDETDPMVTGNAANRVTPLESDLDDTSRVYEADPDERNRRPLDQLIASDSSRGRRRCDPGATSF